MQYCETNSQPKLAIQCFVFELLIWLDTLICISLIWCCKWMSTDIDTYPNCTIQYRICMHKKFQILEGSSRLWNYSFKDNFLVGNLSLNTICSLIKASPKNPSHSNKETRNSSSYCHRTCNYTSTLSEITRKKIE